MKFVIAICILFLLSGCALFDKSLLDNTKIGDGKVLGVDLTTPIKQVFDILPSCNAEKKLTANCIIGCIDGITGSQSTIDPVDRATQDAIKQLGLSVENDEEYLCCKFMGIAGSYLVNKYGVNVQGILSLLRLAQ